MMNEQNNQLSNIQRHQFRYTSVGWMLLLVIFTLLWTPNLVLAQDKSGVKPSVISLPSGPGSLEGLGESFEPNLSTGTSSYPVKFTAAPGRIGFQPEIALNYNGGNANGPWGMGWELSIPSIQRRTDDGIPSYDDREDTFIHSAGEKLVRLTNGDYRFENEGAFMRFRRIDGHGWEANTPDGVRYLFGVTEQARVTNELGIFRWALERVIDTNSNEMRYLYLHDGGYLYPQEIRYNFGPNQASANQTTEQTYNAVVFNYEPRPDTFTDRRSGAPIRMGLRGTNIEMWSLGKLVRAYAFTYEPERSTGTYTLLASVTQVGDDGVSTLPPHTFTYTQFDPTAHQVIPMQDEPPVVLTNPDADLVDINADGLPDLVHTPEDDHHRFYLNLGRGRWATEPIIPNNSPAERLSNPNVRMADMNGDGRVDLLVKASGTGNVPLYYYRNQPGSDWEQEDRIDFGPAPAFDLNDPNLQLMDVNNDRAVDVVLTVSNRLKIWLARKGAWSQQADFNMPAPAAGAPASFGDPKFKIGDMTGDRMDDVVMVRDGQIVLWAHNGNGSYETPQPILNPPTDLGSQATLIQMADLNNDGQMDLVLPGNGTVVYWLSLGNGSLTEPIVIPNAPAFNAQDTAVRLADIDGDGATELLYSSDRGMEYVDFSTGSQPFLLRSVDNGLGRTIHIAYKSSVDDYIADLDAGNPWEINLPFPVQVVSQVTVHDANSGDNYTVDYHYRDGFYDGEEKEFRGFVRSQEIKVGDETAATTITNLIHDVGMTDEARKGLLLETEIIGVGGQCAGDFADCYQRTVNQLEARVVVEADETTSGQPIAYAFVKQTDSFVHEQTAVPVHLRQRFQQDEYGNQTEHFNYGKVCDNGTAEGDVFCGDDELLTYTEFIYEATRYLFNRPMTVRQTDAAGNFVSETHLYYDGEEYVGLPLGQLTRGNLTRETQNLGPNDGHRVIPTKRQAFDEFGNVVGMMDGNGSRVTVERLHLADGQALTYAATYHHGFGTPLSATDYNGNAHAFAYDTFGRLAKVAQPGDTLALPTEQYRYEIGNPHSAIWTEKRECSGQEGMITSVAYFDGLGRKLQVRSEATDGQVVVTEAVTFNARRSIRNKFLPYFDASFEYGAPDPSLPKATIHYDPRGRETQTIHPDGTFTRIVYGPLTEAHYDEEDNKPGSPHYDSPKTLTYDGLERLVGTEEINVVDGQMERYVTRYAYDRLNSLIRIVDPRGNVKSMIYDALKRKLAMDDPDRGQMTYRYDDGGNLLLSRDAKGQEIHFTYDAANRPLTERWVFNNGQANVINARFHYDDDFAPQHPDARNTLGQVTYIEDQAGSVFFSYDPRGNLTSSIRHFADDDLTLVSRMSYDALDRLVTLTYPDGSSVDYVYDERGLLKGISGFIDDVTYTASGLRDQIAYSNHVQTDYSYDSRLRLTRLLTQGPRATLQDLTLGLDDAANVLSITDGRANRTPETDWTQTFRYDSLYQLTKATGAYGEIRYAYDSLGNVANKNSTTADARVNLGKMHYGEAGSNAHAGPRALTSWGNGENREQWFYDANGNLRQKGNASFQWDARNRLLAAEDGTTQSTYLYDADLNRVKQTVRNGAEVTTTFYAGEYAEVHRDGTSGDELILYVFDDERRVAHIRKKLERSQLLTGFRDRGPADIPETGPITAQRHWYIPDHIGGTNLLLDEAGSVTAEMVYYPFGLTRHESSDDVRYGFTGKELDVSGLQYFGARYYEPITGRFISPDPLFAENPEEGLKAPRHLNLYTYGLNNPIRMIDPDGKKSRYVIIAYGTGEGTEGTQQVAERLKNRVAKQLRKIDPKVKVVAKPANEVATFAKRGKKTVSAYVFVGHAGPNEIAKVGETANTTVYQAAKEARVAKGGAVLILGCNAVNGRTESERALAKEGISAHGFSKLIGWDENGSGQFTTDPHSPDAWQSPEKVKTQSREGRQTVARTLQHAVQRVADGKKK